MQKNLRFEIISEGLKYGVSVTCRKYGISRTIYYRWLKRYKSLGIDGLDDKKKNFVPTNKTTTEIENTILRLIKTYPNYGPRALKYLLDELNYDVSESAVYNVLKRNNLSNKNSRIKFVKKGKEKITRLMPALSELKSGACWIFWITDYGSYQQTGNIYEFTLFDFKSRIACSRLYNEVSFDNLEDLLAGVAFSIAITLNLEINYLCFFKDEKILKLDRNIFESKIRNTIQSHGYDVKVHFLNTNDDLDQINELKTQYIKGCTSFLIPLINNDLSFTEIKLQFQNYIRKYNINYKMEYDNAWYSPIEYHNKLTNTKLIMPICAYIDRTY